jgi:hypothetical protein
VSRDNPGVPTARLHDLRDAMDRRVLDAVVTDYEGLIGSLTLPDPDDRHILAAAIVARADVIVTCDPRDFPAEALNPYHVQAWHPDAFIRRMIDLAPVAVVDAVRKQRASLINPPVGMVELLALFERRGLVETVTGLRRLMMGT